MSQELEQRYLAVKTRRETCKTQIATLQGMQDERQKKREQLERELQAEGVDVTKLAEEENRITQELTKEVELMEAEVTGLEGQINQAREQSK